MYLSSLFAAGFFPAFNLNLRLKIITSCLSPQTQFNPLIFAFTFYAL